MSGICFFIAVQYWGVIWTMEAWVMTLGYVGHLWVVFAILWRSSTESEYSLASLHGCFTCRGRRQVILNYNPGPSRMLQYRVASSTRWTLSSLSGSFTGLQWWWKELLPVSSLGHLDYGSMSYDLGLYGTSMTIICYFMAEQYWEAWGLSESVVFHVFYLVSCWFLGVCWCLCWVLFFLCFCCFLVTPR